MNLGDYGFFKLPFATSSKIMINSKDNRINGRIYYSKYAKKEIKDLYEMSISGAYSIVYLKAKDEIYGNGKSSLMANVYWKINDENLIVDGVIVKAIWIEATYEPNFNALLRDILSKIVSMGYINEFKQNIKELDYKNIKNILENSDILYSPNTIRALISILNQDEVDIVNRFTNIRRGMPSQNHVTLLSGIFDILKLTCNYKFIIFIDQFEEYVQSYSQSKRTKMSADLNDLIRVMGDQTTIVVSIHPKAETILNNPELRTFSDLVSASIELPRMGESDLLNMVKLYLFEHRKIKSNQSYKPFTRKALLYSIHRTGFNPRNLINALRYAISMGLRTKSKSINLIFLSKYHNRIFGGSSNKVNEYQNEKWNNSPLEPITD